MALQWLPTDSGKSAGASQEGQREARFRPPVIRMGLNDARAGLASEERV